MLGLPAGSRSPADGPSGRLLKGRQVVSEHCEDPAISANDEVRGDGTNSKGLGALSGWVVDDREGRFHLRDELLHCGGAAVIDGN